MSDVGYGNYIYSKMLNTSIDILVSDLIIEPLGNWNADSELKTHFH